jgi:hypothetical protein
MAVQRAAILILQLKMESFLRRLKYYGIGFLIGLLFVFIFFQNRGCSWLPSNRVKNAFLDRLIVMPEDQLPLLQAQGISKEDVVEVLNDGDVVFEESDTEGDLKVYKISKNVEGKGVMNFFFTLPNESFISEVNIQATDKDQVKSSSKGFGEIIHYPNDNHLFFLDSSSAINCKLQAFAIKDADALFELVKKQGKIDFSKTNLNVKPKAIQYISVFEDEKEMLGCKAIWYKNKINVVAVETDSTVHCP